MLAPCQKSKLSNYVFFDVSFNRHHPQKLFSSLDYFNCKRPEGLSISASVLYSIKNRNVGDTRTMKQKQFQIDAKFKSIHGAMICQRGNGNFCFVGMMQSKIDQYLHIIDVEFCKFFIQKRKVFSFLPTKTTCRKSTTKNFLDHSDLFRRSIHAAYMPTGSPLYGISYWSPKIILRHKVCEIPFFVIILRSLTR